ncbi:MAG: DNA-binding protein WhiA [Armatimonadetes bacterium]|nr:DNA-binding protein WhiA [Armatimonadota bacterium]
MASFSHDVKEEMAHVTLERECCEKSLLAGVLMAAGRLVRQEDHLYCDLHTGHGAVARLVLRLARRFGHSGATWEAQRRARFREHLEYRVRLGPILASRSWTLFRRVALEAYFAEEMTPAASEYPAAFVPRKRCCKRAFLRGAFLAGGSVGHPSRYYHLEWIARDPRLVASLHALLGDLEIPVSVLRRKGHVALYLKDAGSIARSLTWMGATRHLLLFEEVRSVKETRNAVNARVNCETANLERTMRAAVRQVADIRYLQSRIGMAALPPELRQVARARLRFPEASYAELGKRLQPRLSKLSVSRCLQRLQKMAFRLRPPEEEPPHQPKETSQ